MSDEPVFHGSPRTDGARDRRAAGVAIVLLVAFVGLAVAKPWGSPVQPPPSAGLPRSDATPLGAAIQTKAPELTSAAPSAKVDPLPVAFTSPLATSAATWTGLRWRRLAGDDPLNLVTSVTSWSQGTVATGSIAVPPSTPIWTSSDGTHWVPLPFNTSTSFWPGLVILGIAERRTELVALAETVEYCGEPCPRRFELPVVSWTSPDGRTWTPHLLPPEWLASPAGQPPLFASGPAGLLIATRGLSASLATSSDGQAWQLLPPGGFPARFALDDLRGTPTGYVAVGRWMTSDTHPDAATLWSTDGRRWARTPTVLPIAPQAGADAGSAVDSVLVGPKGIIAVGHSVATPEATLWWQSTDGRRWTALPGFPPLGPTPCPGRGCGSGPSGALVGDRQRFVAVRGGGDRQAWVSTDGRSWTGLSMSGDIPVEDATTATLLPAGILLTDGTSTWYGEAIDS